MIDSSTCEIEGHVTGPHVHVERENGNVLRVIDSVNRQADAVHNASHILDMLTRRYEQVERQRRNLLQTIQSVLADEKADSSNGNAHVAHNNDDRVHIADGLGIVAKPHYIFNCSNIHHIKLKQKVGHGVSKQAFLGIYNTRSVAVKMVTRHQADVRTCIDKLQSQEEIPRLTEPDASAFQP
jgi:hypothetical protein